MAFLDRLDELMERKGLNKHQLSQQTGIPYSTIDSLYKKGYDNIKLSTLKKLAAFFDCTLDYLADDDLVDEDDPDEINEYLNELHKRPELKALFSVSKKASKEDIEKAIQIIELFKK